MRTQKSISQSRDVGRLLTPMLLILFILSAGLTGCSKSTDGGGGGSTTAPDVTAPTIVSVSPVDFAPAVSVVTPIVVTFSEAIDPASANTSTISLQGVPGTVTAGGITATFRPNSALAPNEDYILNVTAGVRDLAGNALALPLTSHFHTADVPLSDAGANFVVARGRAAVLDGSGSTAIGGGDLTYDWTQLGGSDVGLLSGQNPAFTAPDAIETLIFSLVVSENGAPSAASEVTVVVSHTSAGAMFVSAFGARVVNQDLAHAAGGDAKKMGAILPLHALLVDDF